MVANSAFRGKTSGVLACDVPQGSLVKTVAKFLKKQGKITMPAHFEYAKTSHGKELPPSSRDWFYYRLASMMRRMYYRSHIGVGRTRFLYSCRKSYGSRPEHTVPANKGVIRRGFQQLQKLGYVELHEDGGRALTTNGRKVLDRMAVQIAKGGSTGTGGTAAAAAPAAAQ